MSDSHDTGRTPLFEEHLAAGGRMVEFAGFELPVQYSSLSEEHEAVRKRASDETSNTSYSNNRKSNQARPRRIKPTFFKTG